MKHYLIAANLILFSFGLIAESVFAEQAPLQLQVPLQTALNQTQSKISDDPVMTSLASLQKEWARIKYQVAEKKEQLQAISLLEEKAGQLSSQYPDRAEPKIWEGIILSTDAGITNNMSSLSKLKQAKKLFQESIATNPSALNGSAYTSLGSLYYQVPGWPISFGNNKKAEEHLKQALVINPDGIDSNFFYGDFLLEKKRYDEALSYFNRALEAKPRPGRELADQGRRQEINVALVKVNKSIKNSKSL